MFVRPVVDYFSQLSHMLITFHTFHTCWLLFTRFTHVDYFSHVSHIYLCIFSRIYK